VIFPEDGHDDRPAEIVQGIGRGIGRGPVAVSRGVLVAEGGDR
jgi:hypothetical protein